MAPQAQGRLLLQGNEIKVRLYGQGLGDCFLFAFPRTDKPDAPCYLVIDCGVAKSTPDKNLRTKAIVENLRTATGGHIDVLAITHQHFDHISSFQDAWQEWRKIAVDAVYLPWTESTATKGEQKKAADLRKVLDSAAKEALERAARAGSLQAVAGFRAQADFLGVGSGEAGDAPTDMDGAMDFVRSLCPPEKIRYFEPGDVFNLPGTECHGYVLGPPTPDKVDPEERKYIELLVDNADGVMYSYAGLGMKVDEGKPGGDKAFALSDDQSLPALASGLLAAGSLVRDTDEGFCPFAPEVCLDWDNATGSSFFRTYYGEEEATGINGAWRRVDADWLAGAANLALRAGDYTNNLSLVLAFDVPGSDKILLFPGDAQVGNWLSWHTIEKWTFRDPAIPKNPPAPTETESLMENLLGRVAFYKVGHHGSHNATVEKRGLELMERKDLVAFVPVSVPVAQDMMGYCPMPYYPVLRALQRKTEGRVFLANGEAVQPCPVGENSASLLAKSGLVKSAKELDLPEKRSKKGELLEGPVPLFLELTVGPETELGLGASA